MDRQRLREIESEGIYLESIVYPVFKKMRFTKRIRENKKPKRKNDRVGRT